MLRDKDLISIQEARDAVNAAHEAYKVISTFSQEKIDGIVKAISDTAEKHAERLGKFAQEETGFGVAADKKIKNIFAARGVFDAIKSLKTVGVLNHDEKRRVIDIGTGVGVVAGIVPSTNPTSTVIFKTLISIKAGNSIVFSPHPSANECILETVKILSEAAYNAGLPEGAIGCIKTPTLNGTKELMQNSKTALILATGGPGLVRSAYSSGRPAIGVGAGNGPAFIDKSADIPLAVKRIFDSKTFDNGTICASEQSIVIEESIRFIVEAEIKKQGGCILSDCDKEKLEKFILRPNGTMNPAIVGKSAMDIVKLAGLKDVPDGTRVLIGRESKVGAAIPFSHEKLAPILAFYVEEDVNKVLEKCIKILHFEGAGHSFIMHTGSSEQASEFSRVIPASRILVNTPGALGGIGATTGLFPSLTLGCGAVGGSSSSNNIGPLDIINIRRVAYGNKELSDLVPTNNCCCDGQNEGTVREIVEAVLKELSK